MYFQADLAYDSVNQSSRLQEILNTCLEVESGLEASSKGSQGHNLAGLYVVLSQGPPQCVGALLFCSKGSPASNRTLILSQ